MAKKKSPKKKKKASPKRKKASPKKKKASPKKTQKAEDCFRGVSQSRSGGKFYTAKLFRNPPHIESHFGRVGQAGRTHVTPPFKDFKTAKDEFIKLREQKKKKRGDTQYATEAC